LGQVFSQNNGKGRFNGKVKAPIAQKINALIGLWVLPLYQCLQAIRLTCIRRGKKLILNKTNSAIRLTHRPTGLQVRVESDRSQHRNKKIALERLQLLLSQKSNNENKSIEQARWLHHYEVKRGSPIRIFCGSEFVESN